MPPHILVRLCAIWSLSFASVVACAAPLRLAVMDVGLIGDLGDASLDAAHARRASLASEHLRGRLSGAGLYEIVDNAPAAELIDRHESVQYLHKCNGCELDIAAALNAEQVLVPWVYRVSNLILTLNYEIRDAHSGAVVAKNSFSFRGDNDKAWNRAVEYLVKDLEERVGATQTRLRPGSG